MNVYDSNLERVELVATDLGPLRDELVFVGGCAAGLGRYRIESRKRRVWCDSERTHVEKEGTTHRQASLF
jgi:hypothetical protein